MLAEDLYDTLSYLDYFIKNLNARCSLADPIVELVNGYDVRLDDAIPHFKELCGTDYKKEIYCALTDRLILNPNEIKILEEWDSFSKIITPLDYVNVFTEYTKQIKDVKGRYSLLRSCIENGTLMTYDTNEVTTQIYDFPKMGLQVGTVDCLALVDDKHEAWMSITANEIYTMKKHLARCRGNVITFGLGLGYFAIMAAAKSNVITVTVVDCSDDVISLFKAYVLPCFPKEIQSKIKIVKADAFAYMQYMPDIFDYCFIDIWKSCADFDTYVKSLRAMRRFNGHKVGYWVEESFINRIRRDFLEALMERLFPTSPKQFPEYINILTDQAPMYFGDRKKMLFDPVTIKQIIRNS